MSGDGSEATTQTILQGPEVLLTVCIHDAPGGYSHEMVRLSDSYEIAVHQALTVFASKLPHGTSEVELKRAVKRADGSYVWCKIPRNEWAEIIWREGAEIGVLMPGTQMPYSQLRPSTKLFSLNVSYPFQNKSQLKLVSADSMKKLKDIAHTVYAQSRRTQGVNLKFTFSMPTGAVLDYDSPEFERMMVSQMAEPIDITCFVDWA